MPRLIRFPKSWLKMMDTRARPKLVPVSVPWQVSPSTPFLRMETTENDTTKVVFAAHYLCENFGEPWTGEQIAVVEAPGDFWPSDGKERGPYRLVRITFKKGLWARMYPSFADAEVIQESAYDWSLVEGTFDETEDVDAYVKRVQNKWTSFGICPNPGMYEVRSSPWLKELAVNTRDIDRWTHYIILGHDSYVEVVADGWQWEEGQVLKGW